jgi:hypothetical protein
MSSTLRVDFLFEDLLSPDDSDIDDLLQSNDTKHIIPIIAVKHLEDSANMNKEHRLTAGHVCILTEQSAWPRCAHARLHSIEGT